MLPASNFNPSRESLIQPRDRLKVVRPPLIPLTPVAFRAFRMSRHRFALAAAFVVIGFSLTTIGDARTPKSAPSNSAPSADIRGTESHPLVVKTLPPEQAERDSQREMALEDTHVRNETLTDTVVSLPPPPLLTQSAAEAAVSSKASLFSPTRATRNGYSPGFI